MILRRSSGKCAGSGVPRGIRTPVASVKGMCPRPLDDGDAGLKSTRLGVRRTGGARRDRTADLLHAMQALSQLSYGPTCIKLQRFATQVHEIQRLNAKPPQRMAQLQPRNQALGVPQNGPHDSKPEGSRL